MLTLIPCEKVQKLLEEENIIAKEYKRPDNYKKIKDIRVITSFGFVNIDYYIEKFLLEKMDVLDLYDSKYCPGNPYELEDDEINDRAVAKEIIMNERSMSDEDAEIEADDFVKKFYRNDGLIQRLKKYLEFDLDRFKYDEKERKIYKSYKMQRCRILYFFYMLESNMSEDENLRFAEGNKRAKRENILRILGNPSMENIDNTYLEWHTSHGELINLIKREIEKELSTDAIKEINDTIKDISQFEDTVIEEIYKYEDVMCDESLDGFDKKIYTERIAHNKCYFPPMEVLYLRIVQLEYIGNVRDIMHVKRIRKTVDNVPPEFREDMRNMHFKRISYDELESFIDKDAKRLSKYVYLREKVSKEEVRKIRNCKNKVRMIFEFTKRSRPGIIFDIDNICDELHIVSSLQAIIMDDQNESFDYRYPDYRRDSSHIPHVQAALKGDGNNVIDALKIYWIEKTNDHWYANLGKSELRNQLITRELYCDESLLTILHAYDLNAMVKLYKSYKNIIMKKIYLLRRRNLEMQKVVCYFEQKGFTFEDQINKKGYLYPEFRPGNCGVEPLFERFDDVISSKGEDLKITQALYTGQEYTIRFRFDYQNRKCIMEDFRFTNG